MGLSTVESLFNSIFLSKRVIKSEGLTLFEHNNKSNFLTRCFFVFRQLSFEQKFEILFSKFALIHVNETLESVHACKHEIMISP